MRINGQKNCAHDDWETWLAPNDEALKWVSKMAQLDLETKQNNVQHHVVKPRLWNQMDYKFVILYLESKLIITMMNNYLF